nr:hypothetical protein CFP56_65923 [Quercus suber]
MIAVIVHEGWSGPTDLAFEAVVVVGEFGWTGGEAAGGSDDEMEGGWLAYQEWAPADGDAVPPEGVVDSDVRPHQGILWRGRRG